MDLRDFIVTPFIILGVYALAYYIRPRVCDEVNYKFFFPALTVKIFGALAVGFIYQFYYLGGDTFSYHTHGSRVIWEALVDDPSLGLSLMLHESPYDFYRYSSQIIFFNDPSSFFVVQVASFFDLLTFSSYSGTAVLFAFISFLGLWYLFRAFYEMFPHLYKKIAICALFVPSVVFWGSGILKDTIVMACLGFATWLIKKIFIDRNGSPSSFILLFVSLLVIFTVKKYVILCYLPVTIFWVYARGLQRIRNVVLRLMLVPIFLVTSIISGFYAVERVSADDPKYAIDKIAQTARTTAYDIGFWSGKNAGSGYSLGELDGSLSNLVSHMPQAINVALFRPYLWEAKNPLMLLSSIEATVLMAITIFLFLGAPLTFIRSLGNPDILFCMVFSLSFAFAVGVSTYNFGTLNRYRIPLVPFYLIGLVLIAERSNKERKVEVLEITE